MPGGPRGMVEGVNLLDGSILWLNGARIGSQGFGVADLPAYDLLSYHPDNGVWEVVAKSNIARLYHSVALLLKDGLVLIASSNPNEMPVWPSQTIQGNQWFKYPTELRIEIFTPWYLEGEKATQRPEIINMSKRRFSPGDDLDIGFRAYKPDQDTQVVLYIGGFVTHSLHMGQQMYYLEVERRTNETLSVQIPPIKMAPGPYFIFVLCDGVPSMGEPVMIEKN
ncbi:uncharacterized protein AB675_1481 [Cyphellophora attinorum]|uniref:Uncharacterized protein n=1 Tax=Cyphellophora attinorum TaxID=1664694 RepID=A0A0N0NJQ0_9EURO|nr:uncharacterized protein AB675_1481 [Phialophora attinorum]KPI37231.1 hypothetical protein AB675_1481 [Phialophora attinorum]